MYERCYIDKVYYYYYILLISKFKINIGIWLYLKCVVKKVMAIYESLLLQKVTCDPTSVFYL